MKGNFYQEDYFGEMQGLTFSPSQPLTLLKVVTGITMT